MQNLVNAIFIKKKCSIWDILSQKKGVAVDPAKVNAITECPVPKDVQEIRSFMGLTRYYHIFINKFSRIANPITTLQKKGVKFVWSQQCQDSFDKLKHLLTMEPTLRIVDPTKYFVVSIDASKDGLGGVLT